jgi:hypothetical protein
MADYGPELVAQLVIVDGVGRRFLFDDALLPPVAAAARRTAVRAMVSSYVRRMFAKQGTANVPAGDLTAIARDGDGWRPV